MNWVSNKCHVTCKVWSCPFHQTQKLSEGFVCCVFCLEFNVVVLVKVFLGTRGALHAFADFSSRVTVKLPLAFTVRLTHAAVRFAQEQVKHMIYYLHGDIFRQTNKQQWQFRCTVFVWPCEMSVNGHQCRLSLLFITNRIPWTMDMTQSEKDFSSVMTSVRLSVESLKKVFHPNFIPFSNL